VVAAFAAVGFAPPFDPPFAPLVAPLIAGPPDDDEDDPLQATHAVPIMTAATAKRTGLIRSIPLQPLCA
jgi:hypothetical protein